MKHMDWNQFQTKQFNSEQLWDGGWKKGVGWLEGQWATAEIYNELFKKSHGDHYNSTDL